MPTPDGLNFWQYNGYFSDSMNRGDFGTADNENSTRGGHTYVVQEQTTKSGCPAASAGSSGQTIGQPWTYINWQTNISDTYTRVWWGWFVPNYSGTLWLQTASDDSSLVYVSEDEFGQPTTNSTRTNVKTAAGGFSAITLVVNNGGAHGRNYSSGSMAVVANKAYFIRIYFGENGGGDNMHFSWNNTGDPQNSTSNTMSYVKLDGSQSTSVLFYTEYPLSSDGGGGGGLGIIAVPLATNDRGYDTNWVISVDKWDSYRSIGYQSTLNLSGLEDATIIAGGGGFDGSYNNIDASFRTQGDASTNWVVANYPASKAFNNDISYVGGQYFKASASTGTTTTTPTINNPSFESHNYSGSNYEYITMSSSTPYTNNTSLTNWTAGLTTNGGVVIGYNPNSAWGSLNSGVGNWYIILQRNGAYVEQTISVTQGSTYKVTLKAAIRPSYGNPDALLIKINGTTITTIDSNYGPGLTHTTFRDFESSNFTASTNSVTLRLECDHSDSSDRTVFIDDINIEIINSTTSEGLYQNNIILADSDPSAVKLDFLFPYPRTATEYRIYPPNQPSVYDASYMPNRWCIYGSSYETIDTTKASTQANGYFLLDSRTDVKPWTAHDASLISVNGSYKTYKIANPGLYRQYRMSILQNSGNAAGELMIGELVYYEGGVGPIAGGGALDGRSDLSGGLALHGDVSGVTGDASGQYPYYAFDGDASNTSYIAPTGTFANNNLASSKEYAIKFEFPEKKTVTKYDVLLTDPSNLSIREWELRGCDNSGTYNRADASTYTVLDARTVYNSGASSGSLAPDSTLMAGGTDGLRGTGGAQGVATSEGKSPEPTWSRGPTHVFNGTLSDDKDGVHTDGGIFSGGNSGNNIFHIMFEFPTSTTITKYKIWGRGAASFYSPKSWQLRGATSSSAYNNGSGTYDVLDIQTDVADIGQSYSTSITDDTNRGEYVVSSPGSYTTYVLDIGSSYNSGHCFIGEIAYYGYEGAAVDINHRNNIVMNPQPFKYYVLDVTKSNYPSSASISQIKYYDVGKYPCAGAGSRDGSINAVGGFLVHGDASGGGQTSSSDTSFNDLGTVPDVSGYAYNAFNNKLDISNSFIGKSHNTTDRTGPWELRYTFPEAKRITHYRIWPAIDNSGNTPCIWEMRGVDFSYNYNTINAGSYNILDKRDISGEAWTPSTTSSLTWGDLSGYKEYQMMNPGYYRQYIMYITGTNNSSVGREVVIGGLAYYESDKVDVLTTREPEPYENHQLTINKGVSQETSDWEIGEILVFNKKLNADEEQSVVSYLERTFYGLDGYDPVGNNRELHLPRYNLKLSDVYSMMDPSALQIEYFHKQDYDRIIDLSSTMDLGIGDMSHAIIKTDDLRNRLLSTDASFTNMFGDNMGYEHNSIVRLSDFRGAHFSGGGGSGEGGTETTYSSGGISYKVHTFLYDTNNDTDGQTTYTFVVTGTIKADFLIVAGGGSGGGDNGGGGGAGGVLYYGQETPNNGSRVTITSGTYAVKVGKGGEARTGSYGQVAAGVTNDGYNSSITIGATSYETTGGGAGGVGDNNKTAGRLGGSGGGGGGESSGGTGGAGVSGQGNAGGSGGGSIMGGGGGGGAGGVGENYRTDGTRVGGDGGIGVEYNIRTGTNQWYAAGGTAGGENNYHSTRSPISGIGGIPPYNNSGVATSGQNETGSGGGGYTAFAQPLNGYYGGHGGTGIVVIRYRS